jgi:hypothetical protein
VTYAFGGGSFVSVGSAVPVSIAVAGRRLDFLRCRPLARTPTTLLKLSQAEPLGPQ